MTKLLGIRTVYDTDPTKPFRVADVIEDGAILPHSVRIEDLNVHDLESADEPICSCFLYMGDNPNCPEHGGMFSDHGAFTDDEIKADYQERNDLYMMGMGY